jgi:hypothetical protein
MNDAMGLDTGLTKRSIERELDLVAGAIRMVAGRGAPAVTLAGLNFGQAVLDGSAAAALAAGVIIEPLWRTDESSCDIRVRSREPWPDRG